MDEQIVIIAALACDLSDEGASIGPETERRDELAEALEYSYVEQGYRTMVIVSAGFAPGGVRTRYFPEQKCTFAEMQREHLLKLGVEEEKVVCIMRKNLWGSLAEIGQAVKIYRPLALAYGTKRVKLQVVTSSAHVRRARFICKHWYGVEVDTSASVISSKTVALVELVKFPLQASLLLWRKRRLQRKGKWPSAAYA